jgi:hypothetical protein
MQNLSAVLCSVSDSVEQSRTGSGSKIPRAEQESRTGLQALGLDEVDFAGCRASSRSLEELTFALSHRGDELAAHGTHRGSVDATAPDTGAPAGDVRPAAHAGARSLDSFPATRSRRTRRPERIRHRPAASGCRTKDRFAQERARRVAPGRRARSRRKQGCVGSTVPRFVRTHIDSPSADEAEPFPQSQTLRIRPRI